MIMYSLNAGKIAISKNECEQNHFSWHLISGVAREGIIRIKVYLKMLKHVEFTWIGTFHLLISPWLKSENFNCINVHTEWNDVEKMKQLMIIKTWPISNYQQLNNFQRPNLKQYLTTIGLTQLIKLQVC